MKSTNSVIIHGWMCNELGLKGNELLIFALIHGFSQDEVSKFYGGRKYIATTFNISLPTVDKALQNLVEKEYLIKEGFDDFVNPNVYWVNFGVVKKLYEGGKETLQGSSKETLLNNTNKQITNIKEKDINTKFEFGKQKSKRKSLFTECTFMIDDFIMKHNCGNPVRNKLIEYLRYRISVKDKPLYTNMWKGMLTKLDKLHQEGYGYESIIDYAIERGYLSFYPPAGCYNDIKEKPWEQGVKCECYTDEELQELRKIDAERAAKGMKTKF